MKNLIREYKKSLNLLRKSKVAQIHLNSMISDTEWAIRYMETGFIPGAKWAVSRWSREKREVLVDPLKMARYITNQEPVNPVSETASQLIEKLMGCLTAREKEAFKLVRGQYYSFSQAAELMGCNKGSVQNLVRRAEKKIALVVRKQTISEDNSHLNEITIVLTY